MPALRRRPRERASRAGGGDLAGAAKKAKYMSSQSRERLALLSTPRHARQRRLAITSDLNLEQLRLPAWSLQTSMHCLDRVHPCTSLAAVNGPLQTGHPELGKMQIFHWNRWFFIEHQSLNCSG